METVYIVGIVVAGIVVVLVILLLRSRIKSAEGQVSLTKKQMSGKVEAFSPKTLASPTTTPGKQPSIEVSGNVVLGGVVRVWRNSVRVARNWVLGKRATIDIREAPAAEKTEEAEEPSQRKGRRQ